MQLWNITRKETNTEVYHLLLNESKQIWIDDSQTKILINPMSFRGSLYILSEKSYIYMLHPSKKTFILILNLRESNVVVEK